MGEESERPCEAMWKLAPDSIDDSTEGKGWSSPTSCGGGVRAFCSGEAVYDWKCEAAKGGRDWRFMMCGDFGDWGTWGLALRTSIGSQILTGVRLLSSSVAEAAASIRSSQRLP